MPRVVLRLAAVFVLIASAAQAQQASRLETIIQRGTLRIGMTGDYLPFTFFDKATSTFKGFDVDVAEALGKALGVKVEYVRTAWPQLSADFDADRFDIAMGGISITPERQASTPAGMLITCCPSMTFGLGKWLNKWSLIIACAPSPVSSAG